MREQQLKVYFLWISTRKQCLNSNQIGKENKTNVMIIIECLDVQIGINLCDC